MALTQNSLCDWDDIVTLFTNLNTERTRFGYTQLSVPSNTGVAMSPNVITTLKNGIADLQNNGFVGTTADVTGVTVPSKGNLVKPLPITTMNTIVNNVRNVRVYSSNFSNFRGASFTFGTNFSNFFDSNFSGDDGNAYFFGTFFSNFRTGNFNNFSRFFSGYFSRFFSNNFSSWDGSSFSFGSNFSNFSGNFNSNFSGNFINDFSGNFMSNDDYVSSIKSGGNF